MVSYVAKIRDLRYICHEMKRFFILLLACVVCFPAFAQKQRDSLTVSTFCISPKIGTDIGGAIPIPFDAIGGYFNAYPRLNVTLGARLFVNFKKHWNIGADLNYKTIAMDADARVTNQKFKGEDMVQYFTGTTEIAMRFTLLEVPVYMKYMFGGKRQHGILLGGYGAYVFKSDFVTKAMKGFIGTVPDRVDSPIKDPMIMDFSDVLGHLDYGVVLGYEAQIFPRVNLGLHVLMGLKDIFEPGTDFFDYKMLPMRGSVCVSYDLVRIGRPKRYKF